MTFSIVARDAATGAVGVAIASRAHGAGAIAPFARAGVGAIASQALPNGGIGGADDRWIHLRVDGPPRSRRS